MLKQNLDIEKRQLPYNDVKNLWRTVKYWIFNIIPQVQRLSLNTWCVIRKELGFKYRESIRVA